MFPQDDASVAPKVAAVPAWSGVYTADIGSRYFGSTVCAIFANQGVAQEAVTVTRRVDSGKGAVAITVWNSTGFKRWYENNAYETDVDVNLSHRIGKYDVAVGGWMFLMNPNAKTEILVFDAKVSRTFTRGSNAFTPYFEFQQYGVTNKAVGYHGGGYPMLGLGYDRKLSRRFAISSVFHENYDDNAGFGFKGGKSLFYAEAGMKVALGDRLTLTAPRLGIGGSWNDPDRAKRVTWSSGIAFAF
jgi:hypothetical protein